MLSPAQIQKYGRTWGAVCAANDWRMARGRLAPEAEVTRARTDEHRAVWKLAEQHAMQQHRSVTVDDLRRGCGAMITRKFCSTKDLTNPQFSRLLDLFAVLIDPDDLNARMNWDHPERREREQVLRTIHALAPSAYIESVAREFYQVSAWETDATLPQLKRFIWILKQHRDAQNRPVRRQEGQDAQDYQEQNSHPDHPVDPVESENVPF